MAPYLPLLEEELAVRGEDRRAPNWQKADIAPDVDFEVLVIGIKDLKAFYETVFERAVKEVTV